ncbi:MAG: D-3-phosphoglycerate dehydrogenase [uncultured Microvirga sp.]|uniref:D-3-phosphoglycerate dehydrogenase n=1 Tax=uncultured Microvirga sp. TaxID=412392 RepID=A0A6J4LM95_9HYPH|nr:MAG: D-3-phosphoglycerate dehydrogenase [uncultured Microvirga sp.]
MEASRLEAALPGAVAVLGQTDLPAERLARAVNLRALINVEGNFLPNVDYQDCFRRGIDVLSIAPVFALPVAEMALGLALDLARGITPGDQAMRDGREAYGLAGNRDAFLLTGATIGLIGFGQLGRALNRLLAGFRAEILVHDPWLPASAMREDGCRPAALDELLAGSRVVFVFASATQENRHFIGRRELNLMQPGAALVLASRAAVVDFPALMEAAESGRLRVATDVFPQEPVPPEDPVRTSRLLLSSHRAGGIPEAFHDLGERVLDDLDLILRGLPPVRLQAARSQTARLMRSIPGRTYGAHEER